jgi:prolycopene isomerase
MPDVVVIGGGLGGLTAAAQLARAGAKVAVVEHHSVPGGYAHEFKRRGGYRFEVALHALDGLAPGGFVYPLMVDLGLFDRVQFQRLDPFYTISTPELELTVPADRIAYEERLISAFPHEADGIRSLTDAMGRVFTDVRRLVAAAESGRRTAGGTGETRYPDMAAAMSRTWADFAGDHISDSRLMAGFSALWGYFGLPPSRLSAATFILPWVSYHQFGAFYPVGGSAALSRALASIVEEHGGEIHYRHTVDHIDIREGRATTVTADRGLCIDADVVVSNANPGDTMLRFVGAEHLPAGYVSKLNADVPAVSSLVVYLGLDRDLTASGWTHHEYFTTTTDDIDADYQAAMAGEFERAGMVITNYSVSDPGCAPPGHSVVALMTLAHWNHAHTWGTGGDVTGYSDNAGYQAVKRAAADRLIDRFEQLVPGVRRSIVHEEIGTPLTNHRYSLNPGGSIYGSEQTVDNMYGHRLQAATPIPNLFLTGAWVFGGGMTAAMLSGATVARQAAAATTPPAPARVDSALAG